MSESKFTPGPWRLSKFSETTVEAGDRGICSTGGYQQNFDTERVYSENRANARLIASAPDLLEALRGARNDLLDLAGDQHLAPAIERIDTAIAKAEGR